MTQFVIPAKLALELEHEKDQIAFQPVTVENYVTIDLFASSKLCQLR